MLIYNYSLSPLSEFMKSKGIVDLPDEQIRAMQKVLSFDYTPTIQMIGKRCTEIADIAVANSHHRVYLKNYSTYQSQLVQELQSRDIRVYAPLFTDMDVDEEIMGYYSFNKMAYQNEVGLVELSFNSLITVEYNGHDDDLFHFSSNRSFIEIKLDETFVEKIRSNNIHYFISANYNLSVINMDELLSDLSSWFDSDILNKCIDMDSHEISDFLNYCNIRKLKAKDYKDETLVDFETVIERYNQIPGKLIDTVNSFNTTNFNEYKIERNFDRFYHLAYLYNELGFFHIIREYYDTAYDYYEKFLTTIDPETNTIDTFHARRNKILCLVYQNKFSGAEILVYELGESSSETLNNFIQVDLADIYRGTNRVDKALEIYSGLIDNNDEHILLYKSLLSLTYYKIGEREKAFNMIEEMFNNFVPSRKYVTDSTIELLIYYDYLKKLPSLEWTRYASMKIGFPSQQLIFFEAFERFMEDNAFYLDVFMEFLDLHSSFTPFNYICFIILFKYLFKLQDYDKIGELLDRVLLNLRKQEFRDNIRLAKIYLENTNYDDLYTLFDISLLDVLR